MLVFVFELYPHASKGLEVERHTTIRLGGESEVKSALFRKVASTNVECDGGSERHEWIFE